MRTETITTPYRSTIKIRQLNRLPNGVYFVRQLGYYGKNGGILKYASFLRSGKIILIGAGNTKKEAKSNTLKELNDQLKMVSLLYDNPSDEQFKEVIH